MCILMYINIHKKFKNNKMTTADKQQTIQTVNKAIQILTEQFHP